MKTKLFIITGVNGIGKSTVIPEIKALLDSATYEVHDFDERGVPDKVDTEWREAETTHWFKVTKKNSSKGINTVVCGFIKACDVDFAQDQEPDVEPRVILLDADPETISTRITNRYTTTDSLQELERTTGKTLEKFIQDNVWISTKFKEAAKKRDYPIVDTSKMNPKQVAEKLVALF